MIDLSKTYKTKDGRVVKNLRRYPFEPTHYFGEILRGGVISPEIWDEHGKHVPLDEHENSCYDLDLTG